MALVIVVSTLFFKAPTDDGLILKNVFAAGVNLGGMTKEQAKRALHEATDNTYSRLDMSVQVLDSTVALSPKDTGARLDVDKVVQAAYDYGRTGSRSEQQQAQQQVQNGSYTISILPYLSLDTTYIQSTVRNLGMSYSTTLSQTRWEVKGNRPSLELTGDVDTTTVFQTLHIYVGTAEYGLVTDKLYEQILDAYNINIFEVIGECSMVAPTPLNYEQLFNQLCVPPVDATIDPDTYTVTPEVYGYGFTLEALKSAVEGAKYGSEVSIALKYLAPTVTGDMLSGDLFQDILASFQTKLSDNPDWNTNMQLACNAINGLIIRAGEEFSFLTALGELTEEAGYRVTGDYVGKFFRDILGGGISQVASTLYNAAILSDLTVTDRYNHTYAPAYVHAGFDASVLGANEDLKFVNSTELPLRIQASIIDGMVSISLVGTDTREYRVEISYEEVETVQPDTLYNTMLSDNPDGYQAGDVLIEGIAGVTIRTKLSKYTKDTFTLISETDLAESEYKKLDRVVVKIYTPPTAPTIPSAPATNPTAPSTTPTAPSAPTENEEPIPPML